MGKSTVPSKATNPSLTLEASSQKIGATKTPITSSLSLENLKVTIGKK